jgi:hypothetical protein
MAIATATQAIIRATRTTVAAHTAAKDRDTRVVR